MKKLFTFSMVLLFSFFVIACDQTHTVSITFESNGGTSFEVAQVSAIPQYLPPSPSKTDFVFENWYIDSELTTLFTYQALLDNTELTLYASYIAVNDPLYIIVTFSTGGGSFIPNQKIISGTIPTEPENPEKTNAVFEYWSFHTALGNVAYDFTTPLTSNTWIYAEYTLTGDSEIYQK